ncbi:hypothetical protein BDP81DRAFT_405534 [Colletotrichum phormii]|uniref:Uncharacterized protein n=1 Tax=Colletotrichum phormii TaxID=359342 RepID=A0AAI9ZX51_9PEZI|nr:uncharacterized protein BDP81DRAFT_405534 [Colletotrichum phormii]KAK1638568.1 hypothetical protein BDP81DRAFT_405534 [Colletotrichum phormii]
MTDASSSDKQAYAAAAMVAAANAQRQADANNAAGTTPAEILEAHILAGTLPTNPDTLEAFRFDCVITVADRLALLNLYRYLVLNLGAPTAAIQGWIAEGKGTVTARIEKLFPIRKKRTAAAAKAVKWYLEHRNIFDEIPSNPTAETRKEDAVLEAILNGATPGERIAGGVNATREAGVQIRLMEADVAALFEKGDHIAYLITRPHMANEAIIFNPSDRATIDEKPPLEIKIIELTADGMCTGVVHVATTIGEAKDYAANAYYEAERMKWVGKQGATGKGAGGDGEKGKAKAKAEAEAEAEAEAKAEKEELAQVESLVSSLNVDEVD